MSVAFLVLLWVVAVPVGYLVLLALAAIPSRGTRPSQQPRSRFAITIPAHDEESVIGRTVTALSRMNYPRDLFDVFVVADHCRDGTASVARDAGAIVYERDEPPAGSKGHALRWLHHRLLDPAGGPGGRPYDAVVVFDADTLVDPAFLGVMDACLERGDQVIQGQHRIVNPEDGLIPALTWAMFIVDNRLQNQGRSNLGWSAKNMGDSICFRADLLRRLSLAGGLTEDYAFRQQLLLEAVRIRYEPAAIGYGEAALTLRSARSQRARWLKGARDADRRHARALLNESLRRRDLSLLDGALQAYLPAYSTLTLVSSLVWLLCVGLAWMGRLPFPRGWSVMLVLLLVYPFWGLALERAPARAYVALLAGPLFIFWRTWLAISARLAPDRVSWVRTPRRNSPPEPSADDSPDAISQRGPKL